MPTVFTHAVLGATAFSLVARGRRGSTVGAGAAAAVSMLPDIDVVWWDLTFYWEPWGHRGMTHSLTAAFLVGAIVAWACRRRVDFPGGPWALFAFLAAVMASHGVMDAMTNGGFGVGFFLPFVDERYFMPIRPVPVAPITGNPFHPRVLQVLAVEVLLFWPPALAMWAARRDVPRWGAAGVAVALVTCAITWGWRVAG